MPFVTQTIEKIAKCLPKENGDPLTISMIRQAFAILINDYIEEKLSPKTDLGKLQEQQKLLNLSILSEAVKSIEALNSSLEDSLVKEALVPIFDALQKYNITQQHTADEKYHPLREKNVLPSESVKLEEKEISATLKLDPASTPSSERSLV